MKGEIFLHLTAVRQLITIYHQSTRATADSNEVLRGLVLETYAYLALTSIITPYGVMDSRAIPLDGFLTKLNPLSQHTTYGTFFSCGHDVFEYIPKIALLAKQCSDEVEVDGLLSSSSSQTYNQLLHELENLGSCTEMRGAVKHEAQSAREIYRRTLLIFLETTIAGPVVDSVDSRRIVQQHIDVILPLSLVVRETNFGSIMMWPWIIVASCLTEKYQRDSFRRLGQQPHRWLTNQIPAA